MANKFRLETFKAFGFRYKAQVDTATKECNLWLRAHGEYKIVQVTPTHTVERDDKHCYTITVVYEAP